MRIGLLCLVVVVDAAVVGTHFFHNISSLCIWRGVCARQGTA